MAWCRQNRNKHEVYRWCRQHTLISDREQYEWFEAQHKDPTIKMFKIVAETDKTKGPVGVCGLTSIDLVNRRAEFSLWVDPSVQKRGIGTHALSLLFEHGFCAFGLNLIYGETFDDNPAMSIFTKLGMKHDGIRRQFYFREGRFIDAHLISITGAEFYAHLADRHAASRVAEPVSSDPDSLGAQAGEVADGGSPDVIDLQPSAGETEAGGQE